MLGLADIKDWLIKLDTKTVADINKMAVKEVNDLSIKQLFKSGYIIADHIYIGKLDNKKEKSIGVYQLQTSNPPNIAIGGLGNTQIFEKPVSILIHWNKNAKETELKALELYYKLLNSRNFTINDNKVNYIRLLEPEPVDVGTDSGNVYERVIRAIFYYKKEE